MSRPRFAIVRYPVTLLCMVAMFALFQAVQSYDRQHKGGLGGQHHYGAASGQAMTSVPGLNGPFSLWNGEWWRILGSGFHHAGLLHLFGNAAGFVYLGLLLEDRIGSRPLAVFLAFATFVSLLPVFLTGTSVIGMSGGIFAMFGLLFIMRIRDDELKLWMPEFVVLSFLLLIPLYMILKEIGESRVSNLAHASGLAYGVLAGLAFFPPNERWQIRPGWFLAGHLLLIPAVYFVVHPVWNARYHWYVAVHSEGEERIDRLRRTVELDPTLFGAWLQLYNEDIRREKPDEAWRALLTGLRHAPTDAKMQRAVHQIWRFASPRREQIALQQLRSVFGSDASTWQRNLGLFNKPVVPDYVHRRFIVADEPPVPPRRPGVSLIWPPVDAALLSTPTRPQIAPEVDPNRPDSALLGTTL